MQIEDYEAKIKEYEDKIKRLQIEIELYEDRDKEEASLKPYLNDENTVSIKVQMPQTIANEFKKYINRQLYSKRCVVELALINLINSDDPIQMVSHVSTQKSDKVIKSIGITISKKLYDEWNKYCEETAIFGHSQLITCAIQKYMEEHYVS